MSFLFGEDYRWGKQKHIAMEMFRDAEARFLYASALLDRGEVAEAKDVLIGIIGDEPDYGRAHNHLGWIYRVKLSDYTRAEYHLRLAVKFAPDYPAGYIHYGNILMELGEVEKLSELTEKAFKVRGLEKSTVFHFMAVVQEMKGDQLAAMKLLKRAKDESKDEDSLNYLKSEIRRLKGKMNTMSRLAIMF